MMVGTTEISIKRRKAIRSLLYDLLTFLLVALIFVYFHNATIDNYVERLDRCEETIAKDPALDLEYRTIGKVNAQDIIKVNYEELNFSSINNK